MYRCNQVFQNCSGLSIDLISRPWEEEEDTGTNSSDTESPENSEGEVEAFTSNAETCQAQKEGIDYEDTKEYFIVYEVLFFESMEVSSSNGRAIDHSLCPFSRLLGMVAPNCLPLLLSRFRLFGLTPRM